MKILPKFLLLLLLLCIAALPYAQGPGTASGQSNFAPPENTITGISKKRAIAIANKDALTKYRSLKDFKIVPCEQVRFWRVVYDGGGPEYVIDKLTGRIIRRQTIPQGTAQGSAATTNSIGRRQAIEIARADARANYGPKGEDVNRFAVFSCELSKAWRVMFDLRIEPGDSPMDFPNGAFPKYVIDKSTGNILYKELN